MTLETPSDSFGDSEQPADDADPLRGVEAALRKRAARTVHPRDPRFEDALQEGRIAFWREYRDLVAELSPAPVPFALWRAEQRMKRVAYRSEALTGHAPMIGRPEVKTVAMLDKPVAEGADETLADLILAANDVLDGVELAYHAGEIAAALEALPEHHRKYVVARFWYGLTDTEIAAQEGLSSSKVLYNRWTRTIRPALMRQLAHLGVS